MIGHEQPFWPGLQPETTARKAHGNTPLLEPESCGNRFPIQRRFTSMEIQLAIVGSNNPKATWHELGTNHIPPRPFLTIAAMGKEQRMVYGDMFHGGPHYREFIEVLHILKHAYHEVKELGEELVDE